MRLSVRFAFTAAALLAVCAGANAAAQAAPGSSSSQSTGGQTPNAQPNPAYLVIDPLAGVRYDNKWDVSFQFGYGHTKAGPNLLQGANLGAPIGSASYYLAKRWRLEGTFRPYLGTSGAAPNAYGIQGPFIAEYFFAAGPDFLGPHNKHGAISAHVLVGGAYGDFEHDLHAYRGASAETVGFYNNQISPAVIMGGHFDLNRSAHWVFRMTPDALLTDYAINYGKKQRQIDINAAFSVGVEYRFLPRKKKKK